MHKKNLIIAGLIALSLHAALIMSPNITSEPEVIFRKGESSLKMNLVPSAASSASTKPVNDNQNIKKAEEKVREKPEPLQKREERKVAAEHLNDVKEDVWKVQEKSGKEAKVAEEAVKQVKEISYSAEYFKSDSKVRKKQTQKRKISARNSKEVIADTKAKGVTTGAVIKNIFKPFYPSSCKRQGHEGTTVLEVTILSKGKCGKINIIQSAGCKSLDKAAIKALQKARYIPAKRLGVPFTATKKIAFNFKLEDY